MFGIAALGLAVHIAGDLITAYGTKILAPLSAVAPSLGWVLVIDPWLTLLLLLALVASRYRPQPGVAAAGLAVVCAFVLFQGALNHHAAGFGQARAAELGWGDARVRALAAPFSPFNRMLIVARDGAYQRARVNLLRREVPRIDPDRWRLWQLYRSYRPVADPGWERFGLLPEAPEPRALARAAWTSPALAPYRAFAHHPVFYRLDRDGETTCAWFTDLRYWYDPLPAPFRFGGCRASATGRWRLHELRLDGTRAPVPGH
jgi:inner membrane protein